MAAQKTNELGIVVKHLLKMWHKPAGVYTVACEASSQVVIDAALADMAQGDIDGSVAGSVAGG